MVIFCIKQGQALLLLSFLVNLSNDKIYFHVTPELKD